MKVVFFGDSICFGQFISPHDNWITQISTNLSNLSRDIIVINSSISGNTTRMALERMPFDVQSHGIDIIYIQFGMNDCNYWKTDNGHPRVSKKSFEANLIEIMERAKIFGAKKILLGTNHPTPKTNFFDHISIAYQESNKDYNKIIRKVTKNKDLVELVDNEKEWLRQIDFGVNLEDLLLADQIHLSRLGHELYFKFVFPYIQKSMSILS